MTSKGKYLAILGLVLQVGWIIGIVGTIDVMLQAFPHLDDSSTEELASDIALALHATVIGIIIATAGNILLCVALFGVKYRALWFNTSMWIISIVWLLSGPIWLIPGIVAIIYLVNHKTEFTEQGVPPYGAQGAAGER